MDYFNKLLFNPYMSNFSTALAVALEKGGYSQASFAGKIGMERSLFNRYVLAKFRPTPETLELICKPFNAEQQAKLVLAHLEDEIPEKHRCLVTVRALSESDTDVAQRPNVELPSEILGAFEFLMRLAVTRPAICDSILSTAKLLGYNSLNEIENKIISTSHKKLERDKKSSEHADPRQRKSGSREGFKYSDSGSNQRAARLNEDPPKKNSSK